jgi:hypothetical protein
LRAWPIRHADQVRSHHREAIPHTPQTGESRRRSSRIVHDLKTDAAIGAGFIVAALSRRRIWGNTFTVLLR